MKITIELSGVVADGHDVDVVVDGERYWCGSIAYQAKAKCGLGDAYNAKSKAGRVREFHKQAKGLLWLAERCLVREGLA